MSADRAVLAFAGIMVIVSLLLTHYVHPNFVWLTVFVGANLFQSAFSGFCPAKSFFKMIGFEDVGGGCS